MGFVMGGAAGRVTPSFSDGTCAAVLELHTDTGTSFK